MRHFATKKVDALMFEQILVPLDGSPLAEQVLTTAAHIARYSHASLHLVQVVSPVSNAAMYSPEASQVMADFYEQSLLLAENYLEKVTQSSSLQGLPVTTTLSTGQTTSAILEVAERYRCTLIVLCSHGSTGVSRWIMGSVAQKLVRHSSLPTFIINGRALPTTLDGPGPKHFMVALDESLYSEAALLPAVQLCTALSWPDRGTLHLMHVLQPPAVGDERVAALARKLHATEEEKAWMYLRDIEQRVSTGDLSQYGLLVHASIVTACDVAHALLEMAEHGGITDGVKQDACDVLAVATHGRSGLTLWSMGSTTERILGTTKLPLLVVRLQRDHEVDRIGD